MDERKGIALTSAETDLLARCCYLETVMTALLVQTIEIAPAPHQFLTVVMDNAEQRLLAGTREGSLAERRVADGAVMYFNRLTDALTKYALGRMQQMPPQA